MPKWLITRLPVLAFAVSLAMLFVVAPSQLQDILASQSTSPLGLMTVLLALSIILGLAHLSFLATRDQVHPITDALAVSLPLATACLCFVRAVPGAWPTAVSTAIVGTLAMELLARRIVHNPRRLMTTLMLTVGAGFLLAMLLTIIAPVAFPRAIGSVPIVFFGLGSFTLGIAALLLVPARLRNIVIAVLLVSLVFDPVHHPARSAAHGEIHFEEFRERFSEWLLSRPDLDAYREARRPYPVIITSAAGGGIVAAAHAFSVLKTLQALCPNFSQHVLASVGVSGGSLGNALFASSMSNAQRQPKVTPCRPLERDPDLDLVLADHMAPVLAAFLFVDVPNALLPGALLPTDRAIALERSIESSGPGTEDFFTRPVEDSWKPTDLFPAQIFVATTVKTGERYEFTPLSMEYGSYRPYDQPSVSVSTAVGASARFPWLTPTARVFPDDVLLADGGYFEDSGADSATDLAATVRGLAVPSGCGGDLPPDCNVLYFPSETRSDCQLRVDLVVSSDVDWGCDVHIHISYLAIADLAMRYGAPFGEPEPPQSFWLDPLTTMLNTRTARGQLAMAHAYGEFCLINCIEDPEIDVGLHLNLVPTTQLNLPLGWTLSRPALNRMLDMTTRVDRCAELQYQRDPSYEGPDLFNRKLEDPARVLDENACGLATVAGLFNLTDPNFDTYYGIPGVNYR